jgi:hypothetical protein
MRVVEVTGGSLVARLASSVLLVAALVGMHHLTAVGCAAITQGHAHHQSSALTENAIPADVAGNEESSTLEDGAPVGAVCIAIVFTLAVIAPAVRILATRSGDKDRDEAQLLEIKRDKDPPDLTALSISRT